MDIREEILRKRRAGKLPGDTTSVLKAWWQSHSKWPYPTVSSLFLLLQSLIFVPQILDYYFHDFICVFNFLCFKII